MTIQSNKVINKDALELSESLGLSPSDVVEWEVRHSLNQKIIEAVNELSLTSEGAK